MPDDPKRRAAEAALAYVEPGMRLGLGTGSTASAFVACLAERAAQEPLGLTMVATSTATESFATRLGLHVVPFDDCPELDLCVDGADEIGPDLALVKGGGGALLREKIVAAASHRLIIIADAGKRVETLGAYPLPIEVVRFGLEATRRAIGRSAAQLGLEGDLALRQREGKAYVTDGGNLILDASFGRIPEPQALALKLSAIPGVVEHGLFLDYADLALVASADEVVTLRRESTEITAALCPPDGGLT